MNEVIQGTDFTITIVVNDDNGDPILLSNMQDYQAYIYYYRNTTKTNLFTFKKTPGISDSQIIALDTTTQQIILNRQQTLIAPLTELYIESVVLLPGSSSYINSFEKIGNDQLLCKIVPSPNPKSMI